MSKDPIIFTVEHHSGLGKWAVAYLEPNNDNIITWTDLNNNDTIKLFEEGDTAREAFFAAHPEAHYVTQQRLYEIESARDASPDEYDTWRRS